MNTNADKTQENKSQSVAAANPQIQHGGESAFAFVDHRPEAVAQRKRQDMANNSPRAMQFKALQDMANNSAQATQTTQLQSMTDNASIQQPNIHKKENNTGLPDNLKTGMENLSGVSLDDVQVHRNSDKPAQVQAHAYAQGAGKTLQRQSVIQFKLDQNGNKCQSHVKWIRRLILEIQSRLDELDSIDNFRKTYLNYHQQTKIYQVGIHIGSYLTETDNTHFSTDNHYNDGNAHRLEFLENRLIGYKLDINALWMEFVNRDTNDFMRKQVRRMATFTTRVLAGSDLATRVLSFNHQGIDKDGVQQHVTDKINAFKRPNLKDWM